MILSPRLILLKNYKTLILYLLSSQNAHFTTPPIIDYCDTDTNYGTHKFCRWRYAIRRPEDFLQKILLRWYWALIQVWHYRHTLRNCSTVQKHVRYGSVACAKCKWCCAIAITQYVQVIFHEGNHQILASISVSIAVHTALIPACHWRNPPSSERGASSFQSFPRICKMGNWNPPIIGR